MNLGNIQHEDFSPELDEKRFLIRLDSISMDFAEKHKLEWNYLKIKEQFEKFKTENRQIKIELLETKRSYLESIKEVNLLRHQLEAYTGKNHKALANKNIK
jgi:hypothetical protein